MRSLSIIGVNLFRRTPLLPQPYRLLYALWTTSITAKNSDANPQLLSQGAQPVKIYRSEKGNPHRGMMSFRRSTIEVHRILFLRLLSTMGAPYLTPKRHQRSSNWTPMNNPIAQVCIQKYFCSKKNRIPTILGQGAPLCRIIYS